MRDKWTISFFFDFLFCFSKKLNTKLKDLRLVELRKFNKKKARKLVDN